MRLTNLGGCKSIAEFVFGKLDRLSKEECSFDALFPYMFSEEENVFYEQGTGYHAVKTTYGQAKDEVLKRSAVLRQWVGTPGSPVALAMENSPDWIENFWAILRSGHPVLLVNLRLSDAIIESSMKDLGVSFVITDGRAFSLPSITNEALSGRAKDVTDTDLENRFGDTFYVMSSGTSSHVKLCAYQAPQVFNVLSDSRAIVLDSKRMQTHYHGELKQLALLPFYHIFGFVAVYLWFAFFSRTFVELKDLKPATVLSTIRKHEVTHVFAVPLFWEKVANAALKTIGARDARTVEKFRKGMKLADKLTGVPALYRLFTKKAFGEVRKNLFGESVVFMISGGGRISPETLRFFNHVGYHLVNGFGMSEVGISSVDLTERTKQILDGSVGAPLSSYRYRLGDDGLLEISGKSIAAYVVKDGVRMEPGEWFPTGDLAAEKDGYYEILGRSDDLIVDESGENLNPNLLEPALKVPGIRELALVPFKENGRVLPGLVLSVSPYLSEEALSETREKLREKLREAKLDTAVRRIFVTEAPLIEGEEFKLNRRRIASDVMSGKIPERRSASSEEEASTDPVTAFVRKAFSKALNLPETKVLPDLDFFTEAGGTSLDYLLLQADLEKQFEVTLPKDFGNAPHSVNVIAKYIRDEINELHSVL